MSASVGVLARLSVAMIGLTVASAAFGSYLTDPVQGGGGKSPAAQAPTGAVPAPAAAAQPAAAAGDADAAAKGRELFANFGCGSCHALSDAGADGHVGPALDGNPGLTKALVVDRVTNGQGPMPAFGGQLSPQEIDQVATYVIQVAKK